MIITRYFLFIVFVHPVFLFSQIQIDTLSKINTIENNIGISKFYLKLDKLQMDSVSKVKILHIGDSHIQPNNFTGKIRELLQLKYGNGGRGMVFPYQLAGTLGPKDYSFKSTISWKNSWIVHSRKKFPIGLAGIGICASKNEGSLECLLGSDTLPNYLSNYTLFYSFTGSQGEIRNNLLNYSKRKHSINGFDTLQGNFTTLQSNVKFTFKGTLNFHGLYVENDQKGIVYSSFGVAGARYQDFLKNELFFQEIPLLKLDLLIVSLGTNEAYSQSFDSLSFYNDVDLFLSRIKKLLPNSEILLTLPSEHYKIIDSLPVVNLRVLKVHEILRELSFKHNCAVWDLFKAMGGAGSMLRWKEEKLVNPDLLHYYKKGYQLQGKLFYDALMSARVLKK